MENESFVMYRSFHEALKDLPPEEYGAVMYAINEYALNGTEPDLAGSCKMAFTLIKPQIDANNRRKTTGLKGGRPAKTIGYENEKPPVNKNATEKKPNVNVNVNVNDNANENENREDAQQAARATQKTRFIRPSLQELKDYCQERNNSVDPQRFLDFYEAKGWKVGNQPMKDWKAAVRTWEQRDRNPHPEPQYGYGARQLPDDRLTL